MAVLSGGSTARVQKNGLFVFFGGGKAYDGIPNRRKKSAKQFLARHLIEFL